MKSVGKSSGSAAKKAKRITGEAIFAICTIIVWVPLYYLVINAFKERADIVKYPLKLTLSSMSFDNFVAAVHRMNFFEALKNTGIITICALALIIAFGSLAGFAIARINRKGFQVYYGIRFD